MSMFQFPFWVRLIFIVLKALLEATPPSNGELKEDSEDSP